MHYFLKIKTNVFCFEKLSQYTHFSFVWLMLLYIVMQKVILSISYTMLQNFFN